MARIRCQTCNANLSDEPRVRLEWVGFASKAIEGHGFFVCPDHLSLKGWPERNIELPPRISDPVAEPALTTVDAAEEGWRASCRECGGIAIKDEREDAEMVAAIHLARRHSGVAA